MGKHEHFALDTHDTHEEQGRFRNVGAARKHRNKHGNGARERPFAAGDIEPLPAVEATSPLPAVQQTGGLPAMETPDVTHPSPSFKELTFAEHIYPPVDDFAKPMPADRVLTPTLEEVQQTPLIVTESDFEEIDLGRRTGTLIGVALGLSLLTLAVGSELSERYQRWLHPPPPHAIDAQRMMDSATHFADSLKDAAKDRAHEFAERAHLGDARDWAKYGFSEGEQKLKEAREKLVSKARRGIQKGIDEADHELRQKLGFPDHGVRTERESRDQRDESIGDNLRHLGQRGARSAEKAAHRASDRFQGKAREFYDDARDTLRDGAEHLREEADVHSQPDTFLGRLRQMFSTEPTDRRTTLRRRREQHEKDLMESFEDVKNAAGETLDHLKRNARASLDELEPGAREVADGIKQKLRESTGDAMDRLGSFGERVKRTVEHPDVLIDQAKQRLGDVIDESAKTRGWFDSIKSFAGRFVGAPTSDNDSDGSSKSTIIPQREQERPQPAAGRHHGKYTRSDDAAKPPKHRPVEPAADERSHSTGLGSRLSRAASQAKSTMEEEAHTFLDSWRRIALGPDAPRRRPVDADIDRDRSRESSEDDIDHKSFAESMRDGVQHMREAFFGTPRGEDVLGTRAFEDLSEDAREAYEQARNKAYDLRDGVKQEVRGSIDNIRDKARDVRRDVKQGIQHLRTDARAEGERMMKKGRRAFSAAEDAAEEGAQRIRGGVNRGRDEAQRAVDGIRARTMDLRHDLEDGDHDEHFREHMGSKAQDAFASVRGKAHELRDGLEARASNIRRGARSGAQQTVDGIRSRTMELRHDLADGDHDEHFREHDEEEPIEASSGRPRGAFLQAIRDKLDAVADYFNLDVEPTSEYRASDAWKAQRAHQQYRIPSRFDERRANEQHRQGHDDPELVRVRNWL